MITNGIKSFVVKEEGALKRCGGKNKCFEPESSMDILISNNKYSQAQNSNHTFVKLMGILIFSNTMQYQKFLINLF